MRIFRLFSWVSTLFLATVFLLTPAGYSGDAGAQTRKAANKALAACRRKHGRSVRRVSYRNGRYTCVLRNRKTNARKNADTRAAQEQRVREQCRRQHPGNVGYRVVKRGNKWWCYYYH